MSTKPPPRDGAHFRDHFSIDSRGYARFRPTYPPSLFEALARLAPRRRLAWDCATGSGQAALGLAAHFEGVIATDASTRQLDAAIPHERIEYRIATAEHSGLGTGTVDLVAVAQALHWFDVERFYAEVRRVLTPGGVVAAWGYGNVMIEPAIDALLSRFYQRDVGAYWPPERALVDAQYASLPFPFEELPMPEFAIHRQLTLDELAGYLRTWSATQRYMLERGHDPVTVLEQELAEHWTHAGERKRTIWPIFMRVGRV